MPPRPDMTRKNFLRLAGTSAAAGLGAPLLHPDSASAASSAANPDTAPDRKAWQAIADRVRGWWDHYDGNGSTKSDLRTADEKGIRDDTEGTKLFQPFPYATPAGATNGNYDNIYGWDTYFINVGMLALGLHKQVRNQILDQLALVERYGKVLNGNATFYLTRGQPPMLAESVIRYHAAHPDIGLLRQAYPLLEREYRDWWTSGPHLTSTGLSTNHDSGDPDLPAHFAAEAETGMDWTPIFRGDVRRCVPLLTNSTLVRYTDALSKIATFIGADADSGHWRRESQRRKATMRRLCWDDGSGWFLEYDFVARKRLPYLSACALWPLWAGVATQAQANRQAANVSALLTPHGLATTDRRYESPSGYPSWLQWEYPAGWAPLHMVAVEALDATGHHKTARRVAVRFLRTMVDEFGRSGELWEKYNVADGTTQLPAAEHTENRFMHGWTSAALVVLGQRVFDNH